MRLIPIECVKEEESYLARSLYDNEGRILLKEGCKLTKSLLKKIKDLKVYSLYIIDEYSDKEINDVISPELRQKSVKLIKDVFENAEMINLANVEFNSLNNKETLSGLKQKEDYLNTLKDLSEDICQNILSNKDISVSLVDIKNMDAYTYQHSVNVATLSVVMGIGIALPKEKLIDLCVGALLHDIGKVFVGKSIIQKPASLTDTELDVIKLHPKMGYDYMKNIPNLKTACKMVVLQHHERVDGTGYPNALVGEDINLLARIVSIADVYDALSSDRPYKRAMCPNDAFEFILSKAGTMFDFNLTKLFSRIIVPYPEGTIVNLSNNTTAVVKKTHPLYPLRPNVKVIKSDDETLMNSIIDLSESLAIVIQSIEYAI
ncbi:HD-GYP domain-containing protein [uncultured Clostridium sp.]|jgi:HD-GYP domain-containing protein (c-di-GMP phosphodiesterase class II)|uniref:HD-GYP domain-containing protein n=1 Tax=uncultured Clostridium sp. TaxID=59620 RepID=UPI0026274602|nr:HD-GYP domain-containing protein [uncultured Clostridium sp.]